MSFLLAAAGAAALPQVVKGISGLFQIGKGNRLARQNIRPTQVVNPLIAQNNAMAENNALVGLPQQQYNLINQGIQRNQAGGYMSLGRSANPSAGLAGLVRSGNDAILNLGAQDANARMQNERFAFGTRSALANEQNRVWDWNSRRKFQEQAAAAQALQGAGRQNEMGALDGLSSIGQGFLSAKSGNPSSVGVDAAGNRYGSQGYIGNYRANNS